MVEQSHAKNDFHRDFLVSRVRATLQQCHRTDCLRLTELVNQNVVLKLHGVVVDDDSCTDRMPCRLIFVSPSELRGDAQQSSVIY